MLRIAIRKAKEATMDFPDSAETKLTEQIMASIRSHIKRDPAPQENHHYNRAFEAIYQTLRTLYCNRCGGPTFRIGAERPIAKREDA